MAAGGYCLACGEAAMANNRRLLTSETSLSVYKAWRSLFDERLKEKRTELDMDLVLQASAPSYICRKCYRSFEVFCDRKSQLLERLNPAIEKMLSIPSSPHQSGHTTPSRKRSCPWPPSHHERRMKYPRLTVSDKDSSCSHASPGVEVIIGYQSKPRAVTLTPTRKLLAKRLARGSAVSVAVECVRNKKTQKYVISALAQNIRKELKKLCSRRMKSLQRARDSSTLQGFNWDAVVDEAAEHAPNLVQILSECTKRKKSEKEQKSVIGVCLSLLCKNHNPKMTLFQRMISLILYAGHSAKKVYSRLHKLHLCSSHRDTLSTLDILGKGYDTKMMKWSNALVSRISSNNVPEVHMDQISCEAVSKAFGVQDEADASSHNITMEFSFDESETDDIVTSTPVKYRNTSDVHSEASSPVSFRSPSYSPVSITDLHECSHDQMPEQEQTPALKSPAQHGTSNSQQQASEVKGVKIVGDNVDKTVKTRFMRIDRQGKSLHYFHCFATQDRFDLTMPEDYPEVPTDPKLEYLLPSKSDISEMKSSFAIHVARILCKYMPYFAENFSDVIPEHLEHSMSSQMSLKSDVVPLGVYLKDENKLDEMVDILHELHRFVPSKSETTDVPVPNSGEVRSLSEISFHRLLFGGDQLTAKRARAGVRIRNNSTNSADRLEGLLPVAEDWHAKVVFLEVIWKRLYKMSSASDRGTLFQLRNLLNRKNIGISPKKDANAHEDFFHLVVDAHVLVAAMEFLGMDSLEEDPNAEIFPPSVWMLDKEERKEILLSVCDSIIEEFTDISTLKPKHDINADNEPDDSNSQKGEDKVLSYATEVLTFGLLYKENVDAIREGDGLRVLSWWRFMMLIFKSTGRINYSIEAFILLAQHKFLLSSREKTQLLYSRFVNMHGLPGRNISCDLYMEHLNRLLKDAINALGANKTPKAIDRLGKCIAPLGEVLDTYDRVHGVESQTSHHNPPSVDKDLTILVNELLKANVFNTSPGRKHRAFSTFINNPVSSLKEDDVNKWMQTQWTKLTAGLL